MGPFTIYTRLRLPMNFNIKKIFAGSIGSIVFAFTVNYVDDVWIDKKDQSIHYHFNVKVFDEGEMVTLEPLNIDSIPPGWKAVYIPGTTTIVAVIPPGE